MRAISILRRFFQLLPTMVKHIRILRRESIHYDVEEQLINAWDERITLIQSNGMKFHYRPKQRPSERCGRCYPKFLVTDEVEAYCRERQEC